MKIIHVNFSGSNGGAAIAAQRLHNALLMDGVDSEYWCARGKGDHQATREVKARFWQKVDGAKNVLLQRIFKRTMLLEQRSINVFPTRLIAQLNASDADIIHFHWVNAEMMRIEQLKSLRKPLVWTFHDMWPFCGAEHYTEDHRYKTGYQKMVLPLKSEHY